MLKRPIKMTMKQLLLLTFFLPTILLGQDTTGTKDRKFFIGVNFSPDYCYRNITKNDNSISSDQWTNIKNLEDSIYKPTFGYTTGLNFYYRIKKSDFLSEKSNIIVFWSTFSFDIYGIF